MLSRLPIQPLIPAALLLFFGFAAAAGQSPDVHPCHGAPFRTAADALPDHAIDWTDTASAGVRGVVYSPGGDPVVSAMVGLIPESEGQRRGVFTDEAGHFEFPAVPPGRYSLRLAFVGFLAQTQELRLLPGRSDSLCIILRVDPIRPSEVGPAAPLS